MPQLLFRGDEQRASKSIAIMQGKNSALHISGVVFLLVVLISFIPYFVGWLGIEYLVIISVADVITNFSTVKLLKSQSPDEGRRYMRWIYIGALFGMLAYIVAQFFA